MPTTKTASQTATDSSPDRDFLAAIQTGLAPIDWTKRPDPNNPTPLSLPLETDDLATLHHKMQLLAQVLAQHASLAIATAFQASPAALTAPYGFADPVRLARAAMTLDEKHQWDLWHRGARMPAFDINTCRAPVLLDR